MKTALLLGAVAVAAAAPVVYEYSMGEPPEPCTGDVMLMLFAARDDRVGVAWTNVTGHQAYADVEQALAQVAAGAEDASVVMAVERAEALEQGIRDAQALEDGDGDGTGAVPGQRGLTVRYDGVDIVYSRMVRCVE